MILCDIFYCLYIIYFGLFTYQKNDSVWCISSRAYIGCRMMGDMPIFWWKSSTPFSGKPSPKAIRISLDMLDSLLRIDYWFHIRLPIFFICHTLFSDSFIIFDSPISSLSSLCNSPAHNSALAKTWFHEIDDISCPSLWKGKYPCIHWMRGVGLWIVKAFFFIPFTSSISYERDIIRPTD